MAASRKAAHHDFADALFRERGQMRVRVDAPVGKAETACCQWPHENHGRLQSQASPVGDERSRRAIATSAPTSTISIAEIPFTRGDEPLETSVGSPVGAVLSAGRMTCSPPNERPIGPRIRPTSNSCSNCRKRENCADIGARTGWRGTGGERFSAINPCSFVSVSG